MVNSNIIVFLNVSSFIMKLLLFIALCLCKYYVKCSVKCYYIYLKVEKCVLTLLTKWNLTSRGILHCVGSCIQIKIPLILVTESLLARYYWTLLSNNTTHGITETQKEELIISNWRLPKLMSPKFSLNFDITSLPKPSVILSMGVPVFLLE